MTSAHHDKLARPIDPDRDHILGNPAADITLVEYGSYACGFCHTAHEVVAELRDRFGDRMRYVFRHLPIKGSEDAVPAAELAEYAGATAGKFWEAHDELMRRGPTFAPNELETVAKELGLPPRDESTAEAAQKAATRVKEDLRGALRSGAHITPTFFINGRRYEGAWDESSLAEAMLGSLGHRVQTAALDFARWAPSTGLLLLLMSVLAVVVTNSPFGAAFTSFWNEPFGFRFGEGRFELPIIDWVNHGVLTIFFLVVGLEIKRELTVGRLATRRAATLPIAAAVGGMIAPAVIYLLLMSGGPLARGWGLTIATDTAFAVALIVLLGRRVPVDLRVFLTAAVIVDDLVAIAVVALFYSSHIDIAYLVIAGIITVLLVGINRWSVYRPLPYAILGVLLWVCLHHGGIHATLAGVILAVVIPTRPPANLHALMAQAQSVIQSETRGGNEVLRHGASEPALRALDAIHDRIESPADKMLRSSEPWSSYVVLPIFALANAGVAFSEGVLTGRGTLVLAIVLGLVIGKPAGILFGSWVAVRAGFADKPSAYSWRQLAGAGALAGIGFTMSLFIAQQAFESDADFAAAKIAIFLASLIAGILGVAIPFKSREQPA